MDKPEQGEKLGFGETSGAVAPDDKGDKRALTSAKRSRSGYTMNLKREIKLGYDLTSDREPDRQRLSVCVKKLRNYVAKVESLNEQVISLIVDPGEASDEVERCADELNEYWDAVYTMETHLEHLQAPMLSAAATMQLAQVTGAGVSHNSSASTHGAHPNSIKLPKLAMPKYSGDVLEFQEFWDVFENAIHENSELSDVEKFSYLKGHLKGKALSHVSGYRLTAANYPHVISTFKERFGNQFMARMAHFEALLSIPTSGADTEQLRAMFDNVEMHIRSLVALGLSESTFEVVLCPILLSKLPWQVRTELIRKHGSKPCSLEELRKLLKDELEVREMSQAVMPTKKDESAEGRKTSKGLMEQRVQAKGTAASLVTNNQEVTGASQSVSSCTFCDQRHPEDNCKRFPDSQSRFQQLPKGLCWSCLRGMHLARFCKQKKRCVYCQKSGHHSSLCRQQFPPRDSASTNVASSAVQSGGLNPAAPLFVPSRETNTSMIASGQRAILQTALADLRPVGGKSTVKARLLLDTGSSRTYIKKVVSDKLRLASSSIDVITVAGFGDRKPKSQQYPVVEFEIVASDGKAIPITANATSHITCPIERFPIQHSALPLLLKMELADVIPQNTEVAEIDVLVGCDHYHDIVLGGRMDAGNGLVLLETRLGAVISGKIDVVKSSDSHIVMLAGNGQADSYDLERFWRLEEIGIKDKPVKEDETVLEEFQQSIRVVDGRYTVRWPYTSSIVDLPDNYFLALGRLRSLMRRLSQDPDLLQRYTKILDDQLAAGITEIAPTQPDGREHYIPHHAVVTPSKATTKLRIVYDGSAKARASFVSLNECLLRGPVLLSNLVGLMIRFRTYRYGMISDVEKAFLQIGLETEDRDVTRFLWLKDPRKPVSERNLLVLRFCRIPFGLKTCSFFLEAVMSHHLKRFGTSTARQIDEDHYADNVATGSNSSSECVAFYEEAKELFAKASMNLREWITNCPQLAKHIPESDRAEGVEAKVLGVVWNTDRDSLRCSSPQLAGVDVVTKRQCLKVIASVFDPCGFLAPFTVKGKVLIQDLWKGGYGWDEAVPENLERDWREFERGLEVIPSVELPRVLLSGEPAHCEMQLHCFCDASAGAYGAVAYVRSSNGPNVAVRLVFSKARVSPAKPNHTIPNLELMAVVVGCRVVKFVQEEARLRFAKVIIWSDSQCTLCWIRQDRVKTVFVRNRVEEIQSAEVSEFRYVRSEENPADLLSRGMTIECLKQSNLWWHGPAWLSGPESEWTEWEPQMHSKLMDECPVVYEVEPVLAKAEMDRYELLCDPGRFSSLHRLLRVTCWVVRFGKAARKQPVNGAITGDEYSRAKELWELHVQKSVFVDSVLKDPSFAKLRLYRDEKGFIRCKGRLEKASVSHATNNPKLLPRDHPFTDLVIRHVHVEVGHASVEHTLAQLRHEFWVPKGRSQVKREVSRCTKCRRAVGGQFKIPQMPSLPEFRVSEAPPFSYTGLDYLGPFRIFDLQKNEQKSWICLFTCASVRSVHLEVVETMSAAGFLMALRRFIAVRGCPRMLVSDNAAQFHSVGKMLRKLWTNVSNDPEVSSYVSKRCISWKFIPEFAPWMGGFYERLVGVTKTALRKSMDGRCLDLAEFQTVVSEVARTVNSRPLMYIGDEVGEQHLTPSHFLNGGRPVLPTERMQEEAEPEFIPQGHKPSDLILQWRRGQAALNSFWKMWIDRYLLALRASNKQKCRNGGSEIPPEVGTVVLVKKPNIPRGSWLMARVVRKNISRDGICRSLAVKCAGGKVLVRPLKFLFPLETACEENNSDKPPKPPNVQQTVARTPRKQRAAAVEARAKLLLAGGSDSE